jgi:DNA-binding winged helix-turn-helix (wHTH) protein/tetratricopeptide (TPR) repeat protein
MDVSLGRKAAYTFGRFRLDAVRRILTRDGVPITLTPKLFDTLLFLVENPGRVVTKDEIMNAVWPDRFVEERNITQTIFTVRKALGLSGEGDRLIETVSGHGYRFTEPVALVPGGPAARNAGETDSSNPPPRPGDRTSAENPPRQAVEQLAPATRSWTAWLALACAVPVLLVAGLAALKWNSRDLPPPAQPNLIVLADFQNSTPDPAFAAVLDKVLEIDLAQSPFLTLLPQQRIRETLQLMVSPKDARLTPELAHEVCARNQGKAVISGTIASAGSRYIVTLQASDCVSGNSIAERKAVADRRDEVPDALDGLSAGMREALDESLTSIRKFDVPIARATTSSFEALRDFSLAEQSRAKGEFGASIPLLKRAIELDPSFAMAYENLGSDYNGLREGDLMRVYYRKAFDLGARTSENERLKISANFYQTLGDFSLALQTYLLWTQTYPRDWVPWENMGNFMNNLARYREVIEADKHALQLNPENEAPYDVLAIAYKGLSRFAESKAICNAAIAKRLDGWEIHTLLYEIDFVEGDTAAMAQMVARESGRPTEPWMLNYEAFAAATAGQLKRSRELFDKAIDTALEQGPDEREDVSYFYANYLGMESQLGTRESVRKVGLRLADRDRAPVVLAEIGDYADADALVARVKKEKAGQSLTLDLYLPMADAILDLRRSKPRDAIAALQPMVPYELRDFWAPSLLGQAYLDANEPDQAAIEFRRILANRGVDGISPQYPLAWLGLGRALHMQGKLAESRAAYDQLFAFWKNADADLPILLVARREYAELMRVSKTASRKI